MRALDLAPSGIKAARKDKLPKADYTTIELNLSALEYTVPSFVGTYEGGCVKVTYTQRNGLGGKV